MSSRVLLIDDNEDDIRVASKAIQRVAPNAKLEVIRDGETAYRALTRSRAIPRLVLLDLSIPRLSGMEILRGLRRTEEGHGGPPIIVFSISSERETIQEANSLGATAYLVKPSDPVVLQRKVEETLKYWLTVVADVTPTDGADVELLAD